MSFSVLELVVIYSHPQIPTLSSYHSLERAPSIQALTPSESTQLNRQCECDWASVDCDASLPSPSRLSDPYTDGELPTLRLGIGVHRSQHVPIRSSGLRCIASIVQCMQSSDVDDDCAAAA